MCEDVRRRLDVLFAFIRQSVRESARGFGPYSGGSPEEALAYSGYSSHARHLRHALASQHDSCLRSLHDSLVHCNQGS